MYGSPCRKNISQDGARAENQISQDETRTENQISQDVKSILLKSSLS